MNLVGALNFDGVQFQAVLEELADQVALGTDGPVLLHDQQQHEEGRGGEDGNDEIAAEAGQHAGITIDARQ